MKNTKRVLAFLVGAAMMLPMASAEGKLLDYHIKCNTTPKKERHCVRFVLE